jgi:voltage-gated potassium channel
MATTPAAPSAHHQTERRLQLPLMLAALLVIPAVVIEVSVTSNGLHTVAHIVNWIIWGLFVAEFAGLALTAPERQHWLRRHWYDVVLIVITIPFLPPALQSLRVLELLTVIEFAGILDMAKTLFRLRGVRFAAMISILVVFAGGVAFALVENGHHSSPISIWDGIWWAVVTVTTVGYGDYYPVTVLGRLIGISVMLSGIGFLAVITTTLANHFIVTNVREHLNAHHAAIEADLAKHFEQHAAEMKTAVDEAFNGQSGQSRSLHPDLTTRFDALAASVDKLRQQTETVNRPQPPSQPS